ncbi:hypothetical protein [Sorangium sp. So ce1078]|uniref:hypothetical protein n=1 Tax=Sorangium sp. So ce1078 TaxID=3133329 RepID=UPI003F63204D
MDDACLRATPPSASRSPFATARLDPFFGMSLAEFDRVSAYDPEMARVVLELVKKSIDAPANLRTF